MARINSFTVELLEATWTDVSVVLVVATEIVRLPTGTFVLSRLGAVRLLKLLQFSVDTRSFGNYFVGSHALLDDVVAHESNTTIVLPTMMMINKRFE